MKCNKCGTEQPDSNFYTYWHSTQQKFRTRRICNTCMYIQKRNYLNKPVDPEYLKRINPEYKKCEMCNTWKIKSVDFYLHKNGHTVFKNCKQCQRKRESAERELKLAEKGGSDRVPVKPNEYSDKYQKEQTFQFMLALGWKFNEESGRWWKPGLRNENGLFLFQEELLLKKKVFIEGKTSKNGRRYPTKITLETFEMMKEMKEKGFTQIKISKELKLDPSTVSKWIGKNRK